MAALVALICVAAHAAFFSRAPAVERFVWVLIGGGLLCLLIPELDLRPATPSTAATSTA